LLSDTGQFGLRAVKGAGVMSKVRCKMDLRKYIPPVRRKSIEDPNFPNGFVECAECGAKYDSLVVYVVSHTAPAYEWIGECGHARLKWKTAPAASGASKAFDNVDDLITDLRN